MLTKRPLQYYAALALLMLSGCVGMDTNQHADAMASAAGMSRELVHTDSFTLTTFSRISRPGQPLAVYIEGDGLAWLRSGEASPNPTPHKALALALAAADPAANVVYIARPCQFTPLSLDDRCGTDSYWTDKRFATEVIAATSQAIDHFAGNTLGKKINLVGYSGGGAVAVLVAASRADIASLRTVAGNLDSEAFNRYHGVSTMPDSLNPITVASKLAMLPQEHFIGDKDDVVPSQLSENFVNAMGNTRCVKITHVVAADHEDRWLEFWRKEVTRLPECRDSK
jgi:hypothetical protein